MCLGAHFVLEAAVRGVEQDEMRPDRRVVAAAGRRHGIVSSRQLAAAGLSPKAISHRVACGWLVRMHRGVYLVGPLEAPLSRAMGAVVAVGAGAVLSHRSAAAVWELAPADDEPFDVTLRGREARHRSGIFVHEGRTLGTQDVTTHRKLPITTPARTLLDVAPSLAPRELGRAVEQAELRRLATHDELTHLLTRSRSHRGAATLRAVLHPARQLTRSHAERRLLALIEAARLPRPAANTRVGATRSTSCGRSVASSSRSTGTRSTPPGRPSSATACATASCRPLAIESSASPGAGSRRSPRPSWRPSRPRLPWSSGPSAG